MSKISRRDFLATSAAASLFSIVPSHVLAREGGVPPSEKLNIGCVGVGGMMGGNDVQNVSEGNNIYALCDIDADQLGKMVPRFPAAKQYRDFREMLDKEYKNLDAITVTTPDHMHASISLAAMERGLAVHCQKPLTQSVWEARLITNAEKKYKVPTQMGNQGYSCDATRVACEMIWSGVIGDVLEVHSMSGGGFARDITAWPPKEDIPATVEWDLWMGHTKEQPYSSKIHPINWRGFLDYGSQMVGDWGIHQFGPANWALQLGRPDTVRCLEVSGVNPVTYPSYSCVMQFPERPNPHVPAGKMPPVKVYWYEGASAAKFQPPEGLTAEDCKDWNEIFVGTKGFIGTKGRGEEVSLLPAAKMKDYELPKPVIERVTDGHYENWIQAVKGGKPAVSNFSIAGPYAEWILLAAVCWRFPEEELKWDGDKLRFSNSDAATEFLKPHFRKGWELPEISA